jgi:hypothetical protein
VKMNVWSLHCDIYYRPQSQVRGPPVPPRNSGIVVGPRGGLVVASDEPAPLRNSELSAAQGRLGRVFAGLVCVCVCVCVCVYVCVCCV